MISSRQAKDINADDVTLGLDAPAIRRSFVEKLFFEVAKFPGVATRNDHYLALARAVRDRILHRWIRSARTYLEEQRRTVIYLSAEYLMGPQLENNLFNLGIEGAAREAMESLGLSLDELIEHEEEPGLGNGGLGRLAACFMDSLATLDIPAIGHGIRYEFGIFDQEIVDGAQRERTDRWLRSGNPWEVRRFEIEHPVGFGGKTETVVDGEGRRHVRWTPARVVRGVPYDTPVVGYGTVTTIFLRLWAAVAAEEFDLDAFQVGEYWKAVDEKIRSENITKVLYPNDASTAGKELRLQQEYFFVSCALQDCIRLLLQRSTIDRFAEKFAIQLNDTHPALAVAGAHAAPRGRARPRLGRGVGDHVGLVQLHEPHAAPRGARDVARPALRPPAPAAPRDRVRDQPPLPRRCAGAFPGRRRPGLPPLPHRRARRKERPHGAPRDRREREGERRGGAALHAPARDRPRRLRRALARPLHERHERRHAAPLPRADEPAPLVAHHGGDRGGLADGPRPPVRSRAVRAGRGFPRALARREAGEQGAARVVDPRHAGAPRRPAHALRRPVQAHSRIQAAAAQPAAHRLALPADPPRRRDGHRAAHVPLRGEGGARLRGGEARHPPRDRGRGDSRAPRASRRSSSPSCSCPTST